MASSDKDLLRTIETNFAALSKEDQDKALRLLAEQERQHKEDFEESFDFLCKEFIAHRAVPDEVWLVVVRGIERQRALRSLASED